jgi:hypothetical protein
MNTRCFVSGSSILLAGWLGATFLNEVPSQRYPKLDKKPATASVIGLREKLAVLPLPR